MEKTRRKSRYWKNEKNKWFPNCFTSGLVNITPSVGFETFWMNKHVEDRFPCSCSAFGRFRLEKQFPGPSKNAIKNPSCSCIGLFFTLTIIYECYCKLYHCRECHWWSVPDINSTDNFIPTEKQILIKSNNSVNM